MTQSDKDLLLKDLCARVPYGVKFKHEGRHTIGKILSIYPHRKWTGVVYFDDAINHPKECDMDDIKPYLFPLSSITEEQYYKMNGCSSEDCLDHMKMLKSLRECTDFTHWPLYEYRVIDWLNKNHFDYRGLIEKGLAIDATNKDIY